jgi:hypothetical protein
MRPVLHDSELLIGRALGGQYTRENKTDAYVTVPPALIITDSNGATWTLGHDYILKGWRYYFGVMRNDVHTGEQACQIEYRQWRVRIFTPDGKWKIWVERKAGHMSAAPGYWV